MPKQIAYIRVSSRQQNLDRQKDEMLRLGIDERFIYEDKASGKDMDRIGYQYMKRTLEPGDTLVLHSLDRLGRDKKEVKAEWEWFAKNKINIRVLDMPILNREYKENEPMQESLNELIRTIVLEVMTWMNETERTRIKQRQQEGIEAAKARGKHLGRPRLNYDTITEDQRKTIHLLYEKWKNDEITAVFFMKQLDLKKNSFYKIIKEYEETLQKSE